MAKGTCSVEGCERETEARGWCKRHYERWRVNGDPVAPPPPRQPAPRRSRIPEDRFHEKYTKDMSGCWHWTSAIDGAGYSQLTINDKPVRAYRWYYELVKGPVPTGLELDHLCANKLCVNPDHLEAVTHRENIRRAHARRRRAS